MQYNILQKGRLVSFSGRFYILQVKINSVGIYSLLSNILLVSIVIFKMLSIQIKKKAAQFTQNTKLISFPGRIELEKTHFLKKTLYLIKPLCARVEHAFALRSLLCLILCKKEGKNKKGKKNILLPSLNVKL